MDEFSEEDIQLSVESDDDTRIIFTLVSTRGEKISKYETICFLKRYIKKVSASEAERLSLKANTH